MTISKAKKLFKVQQYGDRWGFDDYSSGQRVRVRVTTKEKAESLATDRAVLYANSRGDMANVDRGRWQKFLEWEAACNRSVPVSEASEAFRALKSKKSSRYVDSLQDDLQLFEDFIGSATQLSAVKAPDIQRFLDSRDAGERRKFNLRATVVALFRWARRMSYVPDATTEAEKVSTIAKGNGKPNVLTPDQLRTLLDNVSEQYLPWLAIAAFTGIRTEEIQPDRKSKKSPLSWEDFDWDHKIVVVREDTSKVRQERDVPIPDNLAEWLAPWRDAKGTVLGDCKRQPNDRETARLGALIGGWKHNCLRDSFCSYRTRVTQSVAQTSLEMGNSPAMVSRSYHKRQAIEPALEWFDIRPAKDSNVVRFSEAA